MDLKVLLSPPVAFLIYSAFSALIYLYGKMTAPIEDKSDELKRSLYGSGEAGPEERGVPGYKPFLLISLFFALMHLGVLVIGTGSLNIETGVFTFILMMSLGALILG
ncbi:MAG: hypothetical protein GX933_02950 [Chloroflexi bacterium]|nr:hypothetical protein [Chloroflexota bacterium]